MVHKITFLLLAVGGLNWGVWALTRWDVGSLLGGMDSTASKVLYILVGLAAVYELVMHKKHCRECTAKKGGQ